MGDSLSHLDDLLIGRYFTSLNWNNMLSNLLKRFSTTKSMTMLFSSRMMPQRSVQIECTAG